MSHPSFFIIFPKQSQVTYKYGLHSGVLLLSGFTINRHILLLSSEGRYFNEGSLHLELYPTLTGGKYIF